MSPDSLLPWGRTAELTEAGGRALWFYPTIGAAIAAGFPWLTFSCPTSLRQIGEEGSALVYLQRLSAALCENVMHNLWASLIGPNPNIVGSEQTIRYNK